MPDVTVLHTAIPGEATMPRPGSRADRLAQPMSRDVLRGLAEHHQVCVRPVLVRRVDTWTGVTEVTEVPCGATLESKCKPCAVKARRLRQQQIRAGWHLDEEPTITPEEPGADVLTLVEFRADLELDRHHAERAGDAAAVNDLDTSITLVEEELSTRRVRGSLTPPRDRPPRKKRSTRRRKDVVDLPRLPVDPRTVGRIYTGRDGRAHRQSTLLTLTLPSYGDVHSANRRGKYIAPCACGKLHAEFDPLVGTPVDPNSYDYRGAALGNIFFARLADRFWQNLRRAAGWNVQYAGAVEMQKRLAAHSHYAMRGTLPRKLVRQVAAATYFHAWWPSFTTPTYTVTNPPVWDDESASYVDAKTRQPLTPWATAVNALGQADAQPAHVARLGRIDARGIEHGTKDADRSIRYVTKYVTKDISDQVATVGDPQHSHLDRLHAELATLPCSPTCANWLLYGVQPDKAKPGLVPGRCSGKVHQRATLGFTGRRVLISRQWSGKTLADHRADNRAWLRTILGGALADHEDQADDPDRRRAERHRYRYELARPDDPDVSSLEHRTLTAIAARTRWREQVRTALDAPPAVPATPSTPAARAA